MNNTTLTSEEPKTYPVLSQLSRKRKFRLLMRVLQVQHRILEVGSGSGWFATQLRQYGHAVTTLDLCPPADVIGDIREWPRLGLAANTFDVIIALELIEHVDCQMVTSALNIVVSDWR